MTNVAYIPVRGGSKSIPLKNIKPIAGKPLVYWAAKAACECKHIDLVYVSTDSEEIASVVVGFGLPKVQVISRSQESATDTASTELGMLEFAVAFSFSHVVLIQATSPLITSADLDAGFSMLQNNGVDCVLSVVNQKRFIWNDSDDGFAQPANYNYMQRPRRQEFGGILVENGAFYITSREALLLSQCRISGNIKTVEMPQESYIELDEPDDWLVVERLLERRENQARIPRISMFLTDCDGTLTDAGMYYSADGEIIKKFNTRDGVGLRLLKESGIITGIITSEVSEAVRKRAEKLDVDILLMGVTDKAGAIADLCSRFDVGIDAVAYVGDDINDADAIRSVGYGVCVFDAPNEVKEVADYVTRACGGQGAVREIADIILKRDSYAG